ncbi:MAG: class I SAM-dependent methyltransferase [Planctomycetota bacterium]|jgi:SAM-dependent methyltransferase
MPTEFNTDDHAESFHLNRLVWDESVPVHANSAMYQEHFDALRNGGHSLEPHTVEALDHLAPFAGKSVIQLQCHLGHEALSFAQLGAEVVGLDFSQPAVDFANGLAAELDLNARFVCANVYDTLDHIDQTFDLVVITIGAVCWLPDLAPWAHIIAKLLKPGGTLYMNEAHPFGDTLDDLSPDDKKKPELVVRYPYFHEGPLEFEEDGSYADPDAKFEHTKTHDFCQPLSTVINSLIGAGLTLQRLDESPRCVWPRFKMMTEITPNEFELPEPLKNTLPMTYTLIATKNR